MQLFSILTLAALTLAALTLAGPVHVKRAGQIVPGKYIVKLKDHAASKFGQTGASVEGFADDEKAFGASFMTTLATTLGRDVNPDRMYGFGAFNGFSADLDDEMIEMLQAMDLIDYVEEDYVISVNSYVSQKNSPWNLARLSRSTPGTGGAVSNTTGSYVYDSSAGEGTCVYLIDTGISPNHTQFEGRAKIGANFTPDPTGEDGNGHGTHVAGIAGARDFGVAKKTQLYGVKVLAADGFGTISSVLAGLDFVTTDSKKRKCPNGVIANMSLGGPVNKATNDAIRAVVEAGILVVVAAGNESEDSSNNSPASEPSALVVAAADQNDKIAKFSNFGPGVNIFAPGVDIESTWIGGPDSTHVLSGTSMASPHVAGLAAYLMSFKGKMSPQEAREEILNLGINNVVKGLDGPRNTTTSLFAFNGNPRALGFRYRP